MHKPRGLHSRTYGTLQLDIGPQSASQCEEKQGPVGTGMSRARNSRWGMLQHVNEAGIYGGQNNIGVHVYHVVIAIHT